MVSLNINDLIQGDVLKGGYLFFQDREIHSLIRTNGTLEMVPTNSLDDIEQVSLLPSIRCDLVVLSQTCDIRKPQMPTLIVAPVFPCETTGENPCRIALHKDIMPELRNYRLVYAYYIPSLPLPGGTIYPESYIDLRFCCTVSKSAIELCSKVTSLPEGHDSQLRMLLQEYYARPAIPNDIVKATSDVTNKARESNNHPNIYGVWIKWELSTISLVVALHNDDELVRNRLEKATEKANNRLSPYTIEIHIASKTNITLSQIDGFTRFAWDNLSFSDETSTETDMPWTFSK